MHGISTVNGLRAGGSAFLLSRPPHARTTGPESIELFSQSKERLRFWLYGALFASDMAAFAIAFLAAGALRLGSPFEEQSLRTLAILLPTFLAVAINNRAYSVAALERPAVGVSRALKALVSAIAVAIGLLFYFKASVQFSRQIFAIGTILSLLSVIAMRGIVGDWIVLRYGRNFVNRLLILDGLDVCPGHGEVAIRADVAGIEPRSDDPAMLDRLGALLTRCDQVVIACSSERRVAWADALKGASIDVEVLTPELTRFGALAMGEFHGETTLQVGAKALNLGDRIIKRMLDLAIAVPLLIFLAPLMAFVALAIRLESPGPVMFRQMRVGRNNRMFRLLKFRSMRSDACDTHGHRSASRADQRVTQVGKFIRSTSIDELPQLLNVIAGDMSIVGPRPHALGSTAENDLFWAIDSRYFHRHAVKPGITGLAQIRGFRGATEKRDDLTNRLHADLEYLRGWTVWRDLRIIAQTFSVLTHRNAF